MHRPPTTEETSAFYEAVGQGIWYLQFLEDALNKYLTIRIDLKTPGRVPEGAALEALKKRSKGTLGASLKAGREAGVFDSTIEERLTAFLEERNWLVHRCLDTSGHSLYTDEGRRTLLERILDFIEEAKSLQKAFGKGIEEYARSQGVDTAAADRRARAQVARLRGEA
jgi:hypothetical protein